MGSRSETSAIKETRWKCLGPVLRWIIAALLLVAAWSTGRAQEDPYFVTDHHHLPEAGALGLANYSVVGIPKTGNQFLGSELEFEYRMSRWWATQLQLTGQKTWHDSTVFTGYSWVNKFKLVPTNHLINLALSIGWEDSNGANKSIAEIEGQGEEDDFVVPNAIARKSQEHEIETKLIFSRDHEGWNFSGNLMGAKTFSNQPWAFGYSLATSRALSTVDDDSECTFCRKSLTAGLEFYGGLGEWHALHLQSTPRYLGPEMSWKLNDRLAVKVGPHFGLTAESQRVLIHFAVIYDIPGFNQQLKNLWHNK
jgi:hypothetical protein